jgi:hypothetical protein
MIRLSTYYAISNVFSIQLQAIDIRATQQREMLMGGVQKKDVVDPLDGITVPNFAPILIVVPSSVIDVSGGDFVLLLPFYAVLSPVESIA